MKRKLATAANEKQFVKSWSSMDSCKTIFLDPIQYIMQGRTSWGNYDNASPPLLASI